MLSLLLGGLVCFFKKKTKTKKLPQTLQRPHLEPLNQKVLRGSWEFPGDSDVGHSIPSVSLSGTKLTSPIRKTPPSWAPSPALPSPELHRTSTGKSKQGASRCPAGEGCWIAKATRAFRHSHRLPRGTSLPLFVQQPRPGLLQPYHSPDMPGGT